MYNLLDLKKGIDWLILTKKLILFKNVREN